MSLWSKALNAMRHAAGWSWIGAFVSGSRPRYDYAKEVGIGLEASVVMAPIAWLQRNLSQAPIAIEAREGEGERLPTHALAELLERPNPGYSGAHLLQATVFSLMVPTGGNAYWAKVRNGAGRVVELWYVPHWLMTPRWPQDGSRFILHYEYRPGGELIQLEPEDVVHFRMGIDPRNPRIGISPLNSVLREIWTDMEIATFVAALLRNSGIPGLVISPDGPVAANADDVAQVKRYIAEQFTGEKRGQPMVFSAKTKAERLGFNPQELDLTSASDRTEERVCALLGIPPVVVGFHAGTSQTSVGATMREQVKIAWHNCVIPTQNTIAEEIERSLLPDFEKRPGRLAVYFDTSQVEALQEERDKVVARAEKLFRAGIIKQSQALEMVGMESDESHNIYLRPFGLVEIPGDTNRAPAPAEREELPLLEAPPKRLKGPVKHLHSGFEERIGQSAPHAEPTEEMERFVAAMEALAVRAARRFERTLAAFFRDLGAAAAEAARPILEEPKQRKDEALNLMVTDRVIEAMNMPERARLFREHYERHFLDVAEGVARASGQVGLGTDLPDRVGRAVIATGGRRAGLVDLDAQTRSRILRAVAEARAEGAGVDEVARRIEDEVPQGPWSDARVRAHVIARTETKYAQNVSVLEHARANNVERFMVFDGRLGETDEVCAALDGAIVSAQEAEALAEAEHPNGTRSFTPYFGSTTDED